MIYLVFVLHYFGSKKPFEKAGVIYMAYYTFMTYLHCTGITYHLYSTNYTKTKIYQK